MPVCYIFYVFDIRKQQSFYFKFDFLVNFLMQLNNALYLLPKLPRISLISLLALHLFP